MADLLLSLPRPPSAEAPAGGATPAASAGTAPAEGDSGFAPWPVVPGAGPGPTLSADAGRTMVPGPVPGLVPGWVPGTGADGGKDVTPAAPGQPPVDAMTLWLEAQSGLSAGVSGPPAPGLAALDAALPPLPGGPGAGAGVGVDGDGDGDGDTGADPEIPVAVPGAPAAGLAADGAAPAASGPAPREALGDGTMGPDARGMAGADGPTTGTVAASPLPAAPGSAGVPGRPSAAMSDGPGTAPLPMAAGGVPADGATAPSAAPNAAPGAATAPGPAAGADPRMRFEGMRAEGVAPATSATPATTTTDPAAGTLADSSGSEALRLDAPLPFAARGAAVAMAGWTPTEGRPAPEARPVVSQLAQAIVTSQGDRTEIALSPEELGRLRLVMSGPDRAHVTIWADRPETLELLRRNADLLSQQLAEAGVQAGSFEFRRDDRSAWPPLRMRGEGDGEGEGGQAGLPALARALTPTRLSDRRVDIRL